MTQFLRPENMGQRNDQPLIVAGLKTGWNRGEERGIALPRLDQSHSGIAAAERSRDFTLVLVGRLYGVPSWRPEERNQRRRWLVLIPLHRKSERGIGICGRWRHVYIDIGEHCGATAVTMRFARDFRARHSELRRGRRLPDTGQLRNGCAYIADELIEIW